MNKSIFFFFLHISLRIISVISGRCPHKGREIFKRYFFFFSYIYLVYNLCLAFEMTIRACNLVGNFPQPLKNNPPLSFLGCFLITQNANDGNGIAKDEDIPSLISGVREFFNKELQFLISGFNPWEHIAGCQRRRQEDTRRIKKTCNEIDTSRSRDETHTHINTRIWQLFCIMRYSVASVF